MTEALSCCFLSAMELCSSSDQAMKVHVTKMLKNALSSPV